MIAERFVGRRPSHFHINPIVKAYIISEALLWAAWDSVTPIFAVFIVTKIPGANLQIAATGYSIYLITRVFFEMISGRMLLGSHDNEKLFMSIVGMVFLSIAYVGFAFSVTILALFFFYFVLGMGLGIASPAKNTLFAIHLDKNKESTEWSLADAVAFICMALATALGGFIAAEYGFKLLFLIAATINLISMVPYLLYIKKNKQNSMQLSA